MGNKRMNNMMNSVKPTATTRPSSRATYGGGPTKTIKLKKKKARTRNAELTDSQQLLDNDLDTDDADVDDSF